MTLAPPSSRPVADPGVVLGDGTTARTRSRTRWQRARWPIAAAVTFVVVVGLSSLLQARTSTVPFAPDNAKPAGARALAQILGDQGVDVEYTRSAARAAALATEGTTLLITPSTWLISVQQIKDLTGVAGDVVLVGADGSAVHAFTGGAVSTDVAAGGTFDAACDDPDAVAAGSITAFDQGLVARDADVTMCFGAPEEGDPASGRYAVLDVERHRVTVIADPTMMTNDRLDEAGNAALLLRSLGRHDTLVWLVPELSSDTATGSAGLDQVLPHWAVLLGLQGLVVVAALAFWRGRRLGPLVTEPLPVTVRAAEAAVGRGRLYRRSRSWGHAAAALRAGTAQRCAGRLGLPRTAGATEVIDAVAQATGRPIEQVAGLLYGPPPTDDAGLAQLARTLDQLESEVHRT